MPILKPANPLGADLAENLLAVKLPKTVADAPHCRTDNNSRNISQHIAGATPQKDGSEASHLHRGLTTFDFLRLFAAKFARLLAHPRWRRPRKRLRICETISLGNRGFIGVIGYRHQRFLIGGTNSSLVLLAQLGRESSSAHQPTGACASLPIAPSKVTAESE